MSGDLWPRPRALEERIDALLATLRPGIAHRCLQCRERTCTLPDLFCATCRQDPAIAAAVAAFDARQAARRQERPA